MVYHVCFKFEGLCDAQRRKFFPCRAFITYTYCLFWYLKFRASIDWSTRPVWLSGWVFVYELNGCVFKSRCSHLIRLLFAQRRGLLGLVSFYLTMKITTYHSPPLFLFLLGGETFEKILPWVILVILLCLRAGDKNLGEAFTWVGGGA